ncbi:MAG: DUF547 domain-containing protein [Bdellovibrionota bacterium]
MTRFAVMIALLVSSAFANAFDHNHSKWDEVTKQHVVVTGNASKFKYSELAKNTKTFDAYLAEVSAVKPAEYQTFTENQKLAFLFNSYNAYTVKLIQQDINVKSIKDFGSFLSSPWKKKFFNFLGEETFLDNLEQNLARKNFDEPRLHVAFNCASIGCPALPNESFKADKLDAQLDAAAKNFLSDTSRNRYDAAANTLFLSSIFKWYGDDFENSKKRGPLRKFVTDYMPLEPGAKQKILSGDAKIKFLDYDWGLNRAG